MSSQSTHSPEFRAYRRVLQITVGGLTVAAIVYLLISIAAEIYPRGNVELRRAAIDARGRNIEELMTCQRDVERLFREMSERPFRLEAAVAQRQIDLAQEWERFSKAWHKEWLEVGKHCRFDELHGSGVGVAFDHLAGAHAELEDIRLKFANRIRNYIENHAPEIDEIRARLESSRRDLESRRRAERGSEGAR